MEKQAEEDNPTSSAPRRRWYQFSLCGLLFFMALVATALGWFVSRFERERRAVVAIQALGGDVRCRDSEDPPGALKGWLRNQLPRSYVDPVVMVSLEFSTHEVTDAGLVQLAELTSLEWLYLSGPEVRVTDAGLAHIAGLTSLESLNLDYTKVTDAGLTHLAGLTSLQRLYLDGTHVTDAGLVQLARLKSLRHLYVRGTHVTDAGVAELQRALPNCAIERSYRNGR